MMIKLKCPSCKGGDVKRHEEKKQMYVCNRSGCSRAGFRLDYVMEEEPTTEHTEIADEIHCPSCDGDEIRKFGKRQGKQIYRCNNNSCERTTFRREYAYKACDPRVKSHIIDLKADGKGVRDIGRTLSISKDTVTNTLRRLEGENSDE